MQDLTNLFVQALDSHRPWVPQQVASQVASIMQHEGGSVSWSPAAGEEWIGLLTADGEHYALIWTRAPLAICVPSVSSAFRTFLNTNGAVTIEAADWNAPDFRIDPDPIRVRSLPNFWPGEAAESPTTGFSILDLMWVTI